MISSKCIRFDRCWLLVNVNKALQEQGFQQIPLSRPGGPLVMLSGISQLANTLQDVLSQHGERGKVLESVDCPSTT